MRVLLCDDHPLFREGLRLLLAEMGVEVVGGASTGEELVELADTVEADVLVVDLHLPGISGVETIRRLVNADPTRRILVLSMVDDDATLLAALRAGARGYVLKGAHGAEVKRALESVSSGALVIDAPLVERFTGGLRATSSPFPQLTARERDILAELCRGRPTEAIAGAYFLSAKTVRNNVSSILAKLGVSTRAEAVALARDAGFGSAP